MNNDRTPDRQFLTRDDYFLMGVILILFTAVYLVWETRLYNLDGLISSWRISTSGLSDNFYPHHLFYVPIFEVLYYLTAAISGPHTPIYSMQVINSILGAITLVVAFLFALQLRISRAFAFSAALAMGFSFTFWHWSTDADPYIPVNLLIMLTLYLLYTWNGNSVKRIVLSAAILMVAMLIHQMSLVFFVPALTLLYLKCAEKSGFRRFASWFALVALIPFLTAYVVISKLVYSTSGLGSGLKFFFFHGSNPNNWIFLREGFPNHLAAYIYHGILGHYSTFVFSAGPGIYEVFQPYSVNTFENGAIFRFLLPLIIMIATLGVLVKLLYKAIWKTDKDSIFLAVWIIPLFIFLLLWNPGYAFHRIFYLFPLIVVFIKELQSLSSLKSDRIKFSLVSILVSAFIAILFIYNLFVAIIPQSKNVADYEIAKNATNVISKGDLIIVTPEEEYLSRQLRCFTLCERMIEGDFPKAVPALGKLESVDESNLSEQGITRIFKRIFVASPIIDSWQPGKDIIVTFRIADDLEVRKIAFSKDHWIVTKPVLEGRFYEITWIS